MIALPRHVTALLLVWLLSNGASAHAQASAAVAGEVDATISTQDGAVLLPGVLVVIRSIDGTQLAEQVSDGDGRVKIVDLAPATYRVEASLDGFETVSRTVRVEASGVATLAID